jgi:DinB superfamily
VESTLVPVAHQFRDTTQLYARALNGVDHNALLTRPGPRSNPLLWVAGHLVQQRTRLLGALGPERQVPWDDLFGTGSMIGDFRQYPSVGELDAVWRSATEELMRRLDMVTPAILGTPSPQWLRTQDGTVLGALAFAAMHEAYHVGQMGFLRKWLGLDPIFDG